MANLWYAFFSLFFEKKKNMKNLHEMSIPIFPEKWEKYFIYVVRWYLNVML